MNQWIKKSAKGEYAGEISKPYIQAGNLGYQVNG